MTEMEQIMQMTNENVLAKFIDSEEARQGILLTLICFMVGS